MVQKQFEELLGKELLVPVVTVEDADIAVPLAETLLECGIGTIEVTLRTESALVAIERIAASCPGIAVGAGSVTSTESFQTATEAGAAFVVSPGFLPSLAVESHRKSVGFLPGVATPGEVMQGMNSGLRLFKLFPAKALGGISFAKALSAPFPGIQFVPTGGITIDSLAEYLSLPSIVACGGSWLTPADALRSGDLGVVRRRCEEASHVLKTIRSS